MDSKSESAITEDRFYRNLERMAACIVLGWFSGESSREEIEALPGLLEELRNLYLVRSSSELMLEKRQKGEPGRVRACPSSITSDPGSRLSENIEGEVMQMVIKPLASERVRVGMTQSEAAALGCTLKSTRSMSAASEESRPMSSTRRLTSSAFRRTLLVTTRK